MLSLKNKSTLSNELPSLNNLSREKENILYIAEKIFFPVAEGKERIFTSLCQKNFILLI